MKNNTDNKKKLSVRVDKTLAWLADSRDVWREKCKNTKLKLKCRTLAVKRLKDNRDDWRLRCIRSKQNLIISQQQVTSLQNFIAHLESQIEDCKKEIHDLKKKR